MKDSMGTVILCAVFLLLSCQMKVFAGSRAVTPVFVQKGNDVLLEVMKADVPEEFLILLWNFNRKNLVTFQQNTEPKVNKDYSGRVEVSVENYSVKLKNLQETDSGVYTARVTKIEEDQILAEYNVTVQDPVSPVVLTVDSVFNSSDSCNLTVTCSTQDPHISSTFTCDTQTCSQEGGERSKVTTSGASLQVYLVNDSIICNHSNQVSWTKNQEHTKTQDFCPRHDEIKTAQTYVFISISVLVVVIILVLLIVACLLKKRKRKIITMDISDTVYAVPDVETALQPQDQTPVNEVSGLSPTTTYCLVGPHTGPKGSTETKGRTLPESLYAQVERPARS